ncbi:MAG: 50S ribosomal protein L22 [Sedimentisphaerales bacterium]|nr:50S ribosomal protein L22 [Sedimentisphaerales bacterium]
MLSSRKFKKVCKSRGANIEELAGRIARGGLSKKNAISAIKNWQKGLMKPIPGRDDIRHLAEGLGVEVNEIKGWRSSYKYAPISPQKARLVSQLIVDRPVQDAMDLLKFTSKRAAGMFDKVLKSAVADADEQQADVDRLFVSEARVDDAGLRIGTKRWIAKDRGRAHPIRKKASHLYVTVAET